MQNKLIARKSTIEKALQAQQDNTRPPHGYGYINSEGGTVEEWENQRLRIIAQLIALRNR